MSKRLLRCATLAFRSSEASPASAVVVRSSHSQIVLTFHPALAKALACFLSRERFPAIFAPQ